MFREGAADGEVEDVIGPLNALNEDLSGFGAADLSAIVQSLIAAGAEVDARSGDTSRCAPSAHASVRRPDCPAPRPPRFRTHCKS